MKLIKSLLANVALLTVARATTASSLNGMIYYKFADNRQTSVQIDLRPANDMHRQLKSYRLNVPFPFTWTGAALLDQLENVINGEGGNKYKAVSKLIGELNADGVSTLLYRARTRRGRLFIEYFVTTDGRVVFTPEICPMTPAEYECLELEIAHRKTELMEKRSILNTLIGFFIEIQAPLQSLPTIIQFSQEPMADDLAILNETIERTTLMIRRLNWESSRIHVELASALLSLDKSRIATVEDYNKYVAFKKMLPQIPSHMVSGKVFKEISNFCAKYNVSNEALLQWSNQAA